MAAVAAAMRHLGTQHLCGSVPGVGGVLVAGCEARGGGGLHRQGRQVCEKCEGRLQHHQQTEA